MLKLPPLNAKLVCLSMKYHHLVRTTMEIREFTFHCCVTLGIRVHYHDYVICDVLLKLDEIIHIG